MKKRIVVDVDEKLHKDFKVYCYTIGKTITQVLIEFMEKSIQFKGGKK